MEQENAGMGLSDCSRPGSGKVSKPLMEKRRRARINSSLNQLKSLLLDSHKKDKARYSKLEKSDILELTVKHLQERQSRQLSVALASDPTVASKFERGFHECAAEVGRYLESIDGLDPAMRSRLMMHLYRCTHKHETQLYVNVQSGVNTPCMAPVYNIPKIEHTSPTAGTTALNLSMRRPSQPQSADHNSQNQTSNVNATEHQDAFVHQASVHRESHKQSVSDSSTDKASIHKNPRYPASIQHRSRTTNDNPTTSGDISSTTAHVQSASWRISDDVRSDVRSDVSTSSDVVWRPW